MSRRATAHLFAALESGSDALACEFEGRRATWAELDERARAFATALDRAGIGHGERVAVFAGSCLELLVALFGSYYLGAVYVPINTRYRAAEVAHILADAQPAAVLGDLAGAAVLDEALARLQADDGDFDPIRVAIDEGAPGFRFDELLAAPPGDYQRPRDDDLAMLIYTSGTTGPSKGAMLRHGSVVANMRALTGLWAWSSRDRLVLALPLFHVHGLAIGVHGAALHGLPILLERRFDPAAVVARFAAGERGEGTVFMGVPTMYAALLDHLREHPDDAKLLARGRLFTSGSAALSAAHWQAFVERTDQRILERYGMTETLITLSNPYVGVRKPGAVGQPVPGCDAAIVDASGNELPTGETGELIVHSNGIMAGYWNQPEASGAGFLLDREGARWFKTGDIAFIDADGDFHLVGRRSVDLIKSGGFKISAREIEAALASHPAVAELAIVGVPDERWGQRIVACAVPTPGHALADDPAALLAALAEHHGEQLADYKKPRGLLVCPQLPRNALGKLQKHRLLEQIERDGLSA